MKRSLLFITLSMLLFQNCEYEQLHELLSVDFEVASDCYWVTFTPNTSTEGAYFWDFGDGDTSSQKTTTHVYDLAGQYEVTLRVVNEEGVGKTSKNITIRPPSDNTFNTANEPIGSYGNTFQKNILGGYDVLVTSFSSKLTSAYRFSDQGVFEEIVEEGSRAGDIVGYYTNIGFNLKITNNLDEGIVEGIGRAELEGVYSFLIGEVDKYFHAEKVIFEEEERTTFVLGTYGTDANTPEGIFINNPFHGDQVKLPFKETNFTNLFFDMTITPNKGLLLAFSINGNGIHLIKWDQRLNKEWETYLADLTFEKGDPRFDIVDTQEPISIAALSEREYILVVVDADRYFHTDPGIFDAEPKTSILKGNKNQVEWQVEKDKMPSAKLAIAANGDIVLGGSLAIERQRFSSTHLLRLTPEGKMIFEKTISELDIFPKAILESSNGEFLMIGRGLTFLQVDCGGNL